MGAIASASAWVGIPQGGPLARGSRWLRARACCESPGHSHSLRAAISTVASERTASLSYRVATARWRFRRLMPAAAEHAQQRRHEVDRIWRQRLERSDCAADRARCQYQLAEPENRLVVRELEWVWETALADR